MAHKSEALLEPRDVNISGETYSGVPTKELRFGLGGEQPGKISFLENPSKYLKKCVKKTFNYPPAHHQSRQSPQIRHLRTQLKDKRKHKFKIFDIIILAKAELPQVGILCTQFPTLGIFINKKVAISKN